MRPTSIRSPFHPLRIAAVASALVALSASTVPAQWAKVEISPAPAAHELVWRAVASDPRGDGRSPSLPGILGLDLAEDPPRDAVWLRFRLEGPVPERSVGLNLALDTDSDQETGAVWWGRKEPFRFDRLLSVWVTRTPAGHEGILGVAGHQAIAAGDFGRAVDSDMAVAVDQASNSVLVRVARTALEASGPVPVVATVGSSISPNDSLPDTGTVTVEIRTPESLLVDDFEDRDPLTNFGFAWGTLSDADMGGGSISHVEITRPGAAGSRHAARISGETRGPFRTPFAGAMATLSPRGRPRDLRGYDGIRFMARGDGERYAVTFMSTTGGASGQMAMTPFQAGEEWRQFDLPLDGFRAMPPGGPDLALESVTTVVFQTAGTDPRKFSLEIDQVEIYRKSAPSP